MSIQLTPLGQPITQITLFEEIGAIPSKEQAKEAFWGLGDRFWMQTIDGKFHLHGPFVFDRGLHGGVIEPGFLESLKKGCEFAAEHLTEKLTVSFYKGLHQGLCSHFKGEENNTEISADRTGVFRDRDISSRFSITNISEEAWKNYLVLEIYARSISEKTALSNEEFLSVCYECLKERSLQINPEWIKHWKLEWEGEKNVRQKIYSQFTASKEWVAKWEEDWNKRIEEINSYVSDLCLSMNVCAFVSISKAEQELLLEYNGLFSSEFEKLVQMASGSLNENPEKIDKIVQVLFDRYNQKIGEINLKLAGIVIKDQEKQLLEEKIEAIAELFQLLEWLHPFLDGQGRVDLVLQAKLLSEEGIVPAILEQPYFSSYSLLPEWKKYLLHGIECWKIKQNSR